MLVDIVKSGGRSACGIVTGNRRLDVEWTLLRVTEGWLRSGHC